MLAASDARIEYFIPASFTREMREYFRKTVANAMMLNQAKARAGVTADVMGCDPQFLPVASRGERRDNLALTMWFQQLFET